MKKINLEEIDIPKKWYNIQADLPNPLEPPLNPKTHKPVKPEELNVIFPMGLIKQEVSQEKYIQIPDEIREIYRIWRPSPLYRAKRLENLISSRNEDLIISNPRIIAPEIITGKPSILIKFPLWHCVMLTTFTEAIT